MHGSMKYPPSLTCLCRVCNFIGLGGMSVCKAPGRERTASHRPKTPQLARQAAQSLDWHLQVALLWYNTSGLPASSSLP